MSEVVYARVPEALKRALAAYASARGLRLTAALVELLGRGLRGKRQRRAGACGKQSCA